MTKHLLTCIPVICAVMGSVHAGGPKMQQSSDQKQQQQMDQVPPMREITPPAPPLVKRHSADPFVTAEYIYWKAEQGGMSYAVDGITPSETGVTGVSGRGKVHEPKFKYESGFKVGFGVKFNHDSWDVYANYTWLHSNPNHHSSTSAPTNSALLSLWEAGIGDTLYTFDTAAASSKWRLQFNALDVELGRNFFISRRLTLRPHVGLKFGWIEEKNKTEYTNVSNAAFTALELPAVNSVENKLKQNMFGVGIRTGLKTAWFLCNTWSIYGDFAAAGLYSRFHNRQRTTADDATNGSRNWMNFKRYRHEVTPVLEFGLGLRYEADFCDKNYQFLLQAGWEEQIWFNENQFTNLSSDSIGNLTVEGLTVKASLTF